MSYTLRDAQHLCWKTFRKIHDQLDPERGKNWMPATTVSDLLKKAGDIAVVVKEVETKSKTKETLATELSDMLYYVFVLAEHYGINLEESFLETMNNYILRFIE